MIAIFFPFDFPALKISSTEKIGEGWYSQAFNINNEYIFRFPKIQEASDNLRKEICLLPKIESLLNLPIPHFEYLGKPSTKFDKHFVGYTKIKGSFLTGKLYKSLSKDVNSHSLIEVISIEFEISSCREVEISSS